MLIQGNEKDGNKSSAIQTMYEIVEEYQNRQVMVCFVKLRHSCSQMFERSGIYDLAGSHHFFPKINDAVQCINQSRSINNSQDSPVVLIPEISSARSPSNVPVGLPFRRPQSPEDHLVSFNQYTPPG